MEKYIQKEITHIYNGIRRIKLGSRQNHIHQGGAFSAKTIIKWP
jgi:hypothetical protein